MDWAYCEMRCLSEMTSVTLNVPATRGSSMPLDDETHRMYLR